MADLRPPEHYLRQARAKYRIIRQREWREVQRGERFALGDYDRKTVIDAIRMAQRAALTPGDQG